MVSGQVSWSAGGCTDGEGAGDMGGWRLRLEWKRKEMGQWRVLQNSLSHCFLTTIP